MSKAKAKKPTKHAAEPKKPAVPSGAAKKDNAELSDDDLKQVSGGLGFAPVGASTQAVTSSEKWLEGVSYKWTRGE